ncbi:MAG: tetratricopeptide repeat protein [Blastocatellia bacterium]|jgi:tetratricopeptide (TPR) repeat protein|nr:tetratricopeptide repeat protein [Blastocatellia bacterium]
MTKSSGRKRTAKSASIVDWSLLRGLGSSRRSLIVVGAVAASLVLGLGGWAVWSAMRPRPVDYAVLMKSSPALKAYEVGLVASQTGRNAEAEQAFQRALAEDPGNALIYNALATQYLSTQDIQKAIVTAENGVNLAPGSPDLLYTLGIARYKAGRFTEAEQALAESVALNPDFGPAHLWLGNTYLIFAKFGGADGTGDPAKLSAAIDEFRRAAELEPNVAGYHAALAEGLFQRRDLVEARAAMERAVALDARTPAYFASLGRVCEQLDDLDAAISAYAKATEGDVFNADAFSGLGSAYFKKGMDTEAVEALRKALNVNPFHVEAHEKLGQALIRLGQNDEGQKALAAAEESRGRARTIDNLRRASATDPSNYEMANNLGIELARQGDFEDAMVAFQRAITANPRAIDPRYQMAGVYARRGKVVEAIAAFSEVDKLQPGYRQTNLYLAKLYAGVKRTSEATRRQKMWDEQVKAGTATDS